MMRNILEFGVPYLAAVVGAWLVTYLFHSTVLLLGTRVLLAPRITSRRMADVLWKIAMFGGVVTTSVAVTISARPLLGRYEASAMVEAHVWTRTRTDVPPSRLPEREVPVSTAARVDRFAARVPTSFSLLRYIPAVLVLLWIAYATVVLVRMRHAARRARHELGPLSELEAAASDRFRAIAAAMGHSRAVRFTVSEAWASPVALGARDITIPRRLLAELPPDDQCGVVAHEVAHLIRRDPQWLLAAATAESLFFFQPLHRMARMHWQDNAEYLCDAVVARRQGMALELARALTRVAEWLDGDRPLLAPALAEPSTSLIGRVRALLDEPAQQAPALGRRVAATAYTSAATLSGLVVLPAAVLTLAPVTTPGPVRGWGMAAFAWAEVMPTGSTIEVQGVLGNMRVDASPSDTVEVRATRHGRAPVPDIHFAVVRHSGGVTICTLYPAAPGTKPNECVPGAIGMNNSRANQVEVEFAIRVPRGVLARLTSATGHITTGALESVVTARSMSGNIDIATSEFASAETASGNVRVSMGRAAWSDTLKLSSLSGNIRVTLPEDSNVDVRAETKTGTIESDWEIGQARPSRVSRLKPTGSLGSSAAGVIGEADRQLTVSTIAGNIAIRRRSR